jgi:BlaI family transcriptional regulator, penicillinase repressor
MARKKSLSLTDAELRLMNVVWERGPVTVSDVVENISGDPPLHYSTVLTTLRILENKGYLKHRKEGRAFIYRAAIRREQEREKAITHLLRRFFDGSAESLMLNLVEREKISPAELARLRKRIAEEEE